MAENIEFRLKVIEDKLGVVLDQNEKKAKSLGSALNVALGTFASSAAIGGLKLVADGFRNLSGFVGDSVRAASESQDALNRLNVSLSQTGILTEDNIKSFQDFASEIQRTTAIEDDAVISTAAYIQALGRLDAEGLQRATKAAIDLSAALGIDLDSASTILGKASEGNTVALQKLGIQFVKGKTNAETFSNILTTLESRFSGAAQAQVRTFSGAFAQLSNVFNDLQENIGDVIIKNPAVIASFKTLNTVILSLSTAVNTAFGGVNSDNVASFFNLIFDGTNAIVLSVDAVIRVFNILTSAVIGSFATIQAAILAPAAAILNLISIIPGIGDAFKEAADKSKADFESLAQSAKDSLSDINQAATGETFLSKISLGIADAKNNFNVFYNDIKTKQEDLKNNPAPSVTGLNDEELLRAQALQTQLFESEQNFIIAKQQLALQNQIDEDARFTAKTTSDIEKLTAFELEKSKIIYEAAVRNAAALKTQEEISLAQKKALQDKELRDIQIKNKGVSDIRKNDLDNQQAFFSTAATLASSGNKELAAIGKAAALTELAIRTPKAVMQSYEFGTQTGGPILGAILGGIAATAMAVQGARIAGVQGLATGGVIGATMGQDNRMVSVRDGEMVLNADQQGKLFSAINNGGMGGGDVIINIDGREIIRVINNQIKSGARIAS
jgi:hypothetical protein